ncbi:MAG: DUF2975 domain-containing protein [Clostridia bacterium]|nr:DUF2975 domain-containing protein [Clostridia bacterium]
MKLVGKQGLSGVLEVVMWVLFFAAIALTVALPWIIKWMMQFNNNPAFWQPRYYVTLTASGLMSMLMLWQARKILHNANNGTVFSLQTVRHLRTLGFEMLFLSLFYVVMLFCGMVKFSVGIIALVFALSGMMVLVFSGLFQQAVDYKQENDMTI